MVNKGDKLFTKLDEFLIVAKEDYAKFSEKGVKAAGTRARVALQEVKKLCQEIRIAIQDMKNK